MKNSSSRYDHYNVLVTGVGAIIGQGIVKSLRLCKQALRVIGIDRNPNSIGPYLCDVFYPKPACDEGSSDYISFWKNVLLNESIDLVLPGLEVDVFFLARYEQILTETGAILGLNNIDLIELARDKWLFTLGLSKGGFDPIPTIVAQEWSECLEALGKPPFLMKLRHGSGSRGLVRLESKADFLYWIRKSAGNFMIQKIIGREDEEYTVGAFGFGDGDSLSPIIFRRRLSAAGNTAYAEVIQDKIIQEETDNLSMYFKPIGPTNYQFRKEHGKPFLLEINPRLSSSTSLRAGFGYNEAEMALNFYLKATRPDTPDVIEGRAWRFSEDFFLK